MAASEEVSPWLQSLPVAPEYRPTAAEFQNPIAYIFKIEKEASQYGICKIIPPLPPSPKKTAIANLTRSQPTFTTRQQQIGFCPRRAQPVRRRVWHSGHHYSLREFEAKAKAFHKTYLKKNKPKPSPLELETLYWKATLDKPFSVEYANDMPGSAFSPLRASRDADYVGDTAWNMRAVSRWSDSLLRFMKEEIPGVTSPMVYVAMLFSWFAWHVEDHDLHSLNYLHFGAPKTWYGVPRDAAVAFEEVVRVHGYGGEINHLVTFAILGEKTTVMSPEVFVGAGVPCCRLVQNAGEFVVTFPRAYHTGFSHGFNCGEAANIATPEWLRFAKDAAIRRASINYPPMVSHFQLLYDLGLALCSRIPGSIRAGPRSSRLKYKRNREGETIIKELFVQDVIENNGLLHTLGKGSAIVLLPRSSSDFSVCSKLRVGSQQLKVNPDFSLNVYNYEGMDSSDFISDDLVFNRNHGIKQVKSFYSVKEKFVTLCERNRVLPFSPNGNICTSSSKALQGDNETETDQGDGLSDQRLFSCVTCGILSFSCVAIVQPREPAATYLMSADCSFFNDWVVGSGVTSNKFSIAHEDASIPNPRTYTGWTKQNAQHDSNAVPVQSFEHHAQIADKNYEEALNSEREKGNTALALLASVYGNSSDSEEDQGGLDIALDGDELNVINHPSTNGSQEMYSLPSHFQDSHASSMVRVIRLDKGDDIHSRRIDNYDYYMHKRVEHIMTPFDSSVKSEDHETTSGMAFRNTRALPHSTLNCSQDTHTDEDSSRMHIFCLEHAVEAEQQLRPIGGAHILLLCHPDYPKIEAEAKFVAEELGIGYMWKNTTYRQANREDEERIQSALDSEETIPGNGDWAVKLGINLFYSANLSRSALYSKQIPYNSVIYKAFGQSSPASSPTEPKVYQRRTNKQKKVVAGKWCGKVWMSNQVHSLLAKRDSEDVEDETSLHGWPLPDEKIERSESNHRSNSAITKSGNKWKKSGEKGGTWEESLAERDWFSDNSIEDKPNKYQRRILGSKRTRHIERDETASEGDYSPLPHHRKPISKHSESSENDAISDDLLDDDYCIQRQRRANTNEAKFIDSDVLSDDTMDYGSDWLHRGELSNDQDAISDNSLGVGSLRLCRNNPIGKYDKYITEEDLVSDDQREVCYWKKGKISKGRKRSLSAKNIDKLEHRRQKQQQRNLRSRQGQHLAIENIISDDQMEGHFFKYQRRIPKRRQAKFINEEDVMSDDQLKDHFQKPQRTTRRSRQNKYNDKDVIDDLAENNFHILYRTRKQKQAKGMDEDNINSDDQMEDIFHQQHKRTLQSKQSKSHILQQMKQTNLLHVRNKISCPVKQGDVLMKSKAARRAKNQSGNPKDITLRVEEEEDGGPRTRLRKRVLKNQESEGKLKEKRIKREKVKNTTGVKVSAGHAKAKDEESEYQCDIEGCTMSFGSKQELLQHKRNICPVKGCGKKFFSHKYLVQHRRVHEDDRPLKCPWKGCKMTFKWAWARTEHIRVHTGARPYVCAETGCGQTFRFVSDFSRHKRKTGHATKKNF